MDSTNAPTLADRAKHLTALKNSPSFPIFKGIVEKEIQRNMRAFLRTAAATPQQLDYARGLLYGLQWALAVIEKGEKQFDEAMQVATVYREAEGG